MTAPDPSLSKALFMAMEGTEAHAKTLNVIDGLTAEQAGQKVTGSPHTIFQLLNHLAYWQDLCLEWLGGKEPGWPEHDPEGWPGEEGPKDQKELDDLVDRFRAGLDGAMVQVDREDMFEVRENWAPVQLLRSVASHNSYHMGQIVLLRRMIGAWPPPGGGDSW